MLGRIELKKLVAPVDCQPILVIMMPNCNVIEGLELKTLLVTHRVPTLKSVLVILEMTGVSL